MSVATTLSRTRIEVEPGSEESFEVLVRNTGDVVDQFTVTVLGRAQRWTRVEPSVVNLMPGTEETVTLCFAPPKSPEARAGEVPVAVRIVSREDPTSVIVEEATVVVKPYVDLDVRLEPPKKRGAFAARYKLHVENRGNCTVRCQASGFHPEEEDQLDITVAHTEFTSEPGTESTTRVRAKPHKRFLRGQPQPLPFVVEVAGDQLEKPTLVDGVMIQNPMLPPWLFKVLLILVAVITALVLWLLLFAPQPESVATASGAAAPLEQVPPEVPPAAAPPPEVAPPAGPAIPPEDPAAAAAAAAAAAVPVPPEAPAAPQPAAAAAAAAVPPEAAPAATPAQQATANQATGPVPPAPPQAPQAPEAPQQPTGNNPNPTVSGQPDPTTVRSAFTPVATSPAHRMVDLQAPKGFYRQYVVTGVDPRVTVSGPRDVVGAPGQRARLIVTMPDQQVAVNDGVTARTVNAVVLKDQVVLVNLVCEEPAPGADACSFSPTFALTP